MPNTKIKKRLLPRFIIYILPIFVLVFASCSSKELSRSSAQKLIEASEQYKQPFTISLMQGQVTNAYGDSLDVLESAEETPEQAAARKITAYFELYPQIGAANQLGLVEAQVKAKQSSQPKRQYSWLTPAWAFDEKYSPSDKAKALWKEYNLPPTADTVPLAGKEIVEITGITKQGEDTATAQFTWKFVPNEAGKAFDTSTAEFKALPVRLQQLLEGTLPEKQQYRTENKTMSFAAIRQGQATFRRYDDGWRLEAVTFL